eukprot:3880108-Rhodomonas_salina.1
MEMLVVAVQTVPGMHLAAELTDRYADGKDDGENEGKHGVHRAWNTAKSNARNRIPRANGVEKGSDWN